MVFGHSCELYTVISSIFMQQLFARLHICTIFEMDIFMTAFQMGSLANFREQRFEGSITAADKG